jgi:hypothetical protein
MALDDVLATERRNQPPSPPVQEHHHQHQHHHSNMPTAGPAGVDLPTPEPDATDPAPLPDVLRTLVAEVLHHKERLPEPSFLRVVSRLLGISQDDAGRLWQQVPEAARRAAHGQSRNDQKAAKAGEERLNALLKGLEN